MQFDRPHKDKSNEFIIHGDGEQAELTKIRHNNIEYCIYSITINYTDSTMTSSSFKALQHDSRYCASQVLPVNQMTAHSPHIYMTYYFFL